MNVQIAEEKAIQEAVYASIELNNVKNEVNSAIAEKTKDIQPLLGLNDNIYVMHLHGKVWQSTMNL